MGDFYNAFAEGVNGNYEAELAYWQRLSRDAGDEVLAGQGRTVATSRVDVYRSLTLAALSSSCDARGAAMVACTAVMAVGGTHPKDLVDTLWG